jgi:hypothetical protein
METKPGYLTTEFWVSILTGIYMALNTTGILDEIPTKWSTIALAVVSAAYAVSRGQAKSGVKPDVPPA